MRCSAGCTGVAGSAACHSADDRVELGEHLVVRDLAENAHALRERIAVERDDALRRENRTRQRIGACAPATLGFFSPARIDAASEKLSAYVRLLGWVATTIAIGRVGGELGARGGVERGRKPFSLGSEVERGGRSARAAVGRRPPNRAPRAYPPPIWTSEFGCRRPSEGRATWQSVIVASKVQKSNGRAPSRVRRAAACGGQLREPRL